MSDVASAESLLRGLPGAPESVADVLPRRAFSSGSFDDVDEVPFGGDDPGVGLGDLDAR